MHLYRLIWSELVLRSVFMGISVDSVMYAVSGQDSVLSASEVVCDICSPYLGSSLSGWRPAELLLRGFQA